ncbi:MAG: hypothetical protein M3Z04_15310 [Chloroflexota bacterium]|nr:hypothetical protein [Chloroflexota bacterium]
MKEFIKSWRELDIPDTSQWTPGERGKYYDPNRPPLPVQREAPWVRSLLAVLGMLLRAVLQDLRTGVSRLVRSVIHPRRPRPRPRHGK